MGYSQPRRLEERVAHEVGLALLLLGVAVVQAALLPRPLGFAPNLLLLLSSARRCLPAQPAPLAGRSMAG